MSAPIVHSPFCTKPDVRDHCACGANRSCSTCGWGNGQYPCDCNRASYASLCANDPRSPSGKERP